MTQSRVPPPREPLCLSRPYRSSQKGGTLIAELVLDLAEHLRRLADPDSYRPSECPSCEGSCLHVHDYRTRVCQAPGVPAVGVVRYRCVDCKGRWQVLPAFIARHLWYHWPIVADACVQSVEQAAAPLQQTPSERTVKRWLGRLFSSARVLVQLLATSAEAKLVAVAQHVGLDPTRWELLDTLARPLAAVAALTHRLMPGVRLM